MPMPMPRTRPSSAHQRRNGVRHCACCAKDTEPACTPLRSLPLHSTCPTFRSALLTTAHARSASLRSAPPHLRSTHRLTCMTASPPPSVRHGTCPAMPGRPAWPGATWQARCSCSSLTYSDELIKDVLASTKPFAVVGVCHNWKRPSYSAANSTGSAPRTPRPSAHFPQPQLEAPLVLRALSQPHM